MNEFINVTQQLFKGFGENCFIFAITLLLALPLGLIVSMGSMSKFKPLKWLTKAFVWVIRGTPLMLQLFVVFYIPPLVSNGGFNFPRMQAALIAFVINYAAYFSEIYRGGIESIPKGQYEAAAVLGYSRIQTFWKIIFPQMVKRVLPPVTNEVITLVKDTSLAFALAYTEMFTLAKQVAASTASIMPLFIAGLFYYIFNFVVAMVMEQIEKRMQYFD